MGLAALLNRDASAVPAGPPGAAGPASTEEIGFAPSSRALPPPTEQSALSVPAFWRGHAYVCGSVGLLPVAAWRDTDLIDPPPPVIRQPDLNQTAMAFWAGLTSAVTLYGNSICLITSKDRLGYPTSLYPVHPLNAAVKLAGNPSSPLIAGWYLSGHFYDATQVWHVKSHLARAGWPLGRGLLDAVPDGIAAAQAVQDYGARFFASGGMPSGVLKIHRPEVTQEQADDAKANWVKKFSGAGTPAVLNDLTDFTPVAFRPVNSQMVEARQLSLTEVALMWGLPPSKLGSNVGGGTYRNAEMEEVQARNDGVAPWTGLFEQAVTNDLLPRGQRAAWNLDAKLRADTLTRFQAYQTALGGPGPQSAWMLTDEVRDLENMDPVREVLAEGAFGAIDVAAPPLAPAPPAPAPAPVGGD